MEDFTFFQITAEQRSLVTFTSYSQPFFKSKKNQNGQTYLPNLTQTLLPENLA